jgi:putative SOS response-associated peptidase YedK
LYREIVSLCIARLEFPPRYNVAPTQKAFVVRVKDGHGELAEMRWGLVYFGAAARII